VVEDGLSVVVAWTVHMQVPPLRIATCRDASVGMTAILGMVGKAGPSVSLGMAGLNKEGAAGGRAFLALFW
jgi:hypothetical protein